MAQSWPIREALPYSSTTFFATEGNAMARPIDQWLRPEGDDAAYAELTVLAARLRELILAQPLPDLLGYLHAQLLLGRLAQPGEAAAHVRATERRTRSTYPAAIRLGVRARRVGRPRGTCGRPLQ